MEMVAGSVSADLIRIVSIRGCYPGHRHSYQRTSLLSHIDHDLRIRPAMLADNKPAKYGVPQTLTGVAVLAVIGVSLLAWRGYEPVLRIAADQWVISDTVDPVEAVVVLGGGVRRPYTAAELYRGGLASRILVDNDFDRKLVLSLNVPPQDVVMFGAGPRNTYEEACALEDWVGKNAVHGIIIATELFPSRRVRWIFTRKLMDLGVRVTIDVIPNPRIAADNWWFNGDGRAQFLTEIAKYFYYRVRYAFAQC